MKILGVSGALAVQNHDCSAALLIDGKLVGNYEEERFNRVKHSVGLFPYLSIKHLLDNNNLKLEDLDAISISVGSDDDFNTILKNIDPTCKKEFHNYHKYHHLGHIADTYYQSGFNNAAIVIIDGDGDLKEGITIAHMKNGKLEILKKYDYRKSLGMLYNTCSSFCGFEMFGEGKLMGLTSFGKDLGLRLLKFNNETKDIDILYDTLPFDEIVNSDNSEDIVCCMMENFIEKKFYPYEMKDNETSLLYYIDIARTIQENFNEVYLDIVKYTKELTNEDNLCVTGGCIQNCIGNNLVVESGIFKHVFVPPAPHDAGCGAGYAFYTAYQLGEPIERKRLTNSYVGKIYTDEEILSACKDVNVETCNIEDITKIIMDDKIIAWFQDGSELGPRALGHRSILANPSNRDNLTIINNEIKYRENWRPLAPTVPSELFDMIFDIKNYDLTEFMLRTIPIKEEWRNKLVAVCHIDGTTRPQRLLRNDNEILYDLIMNFYNKSGIPCVINTSFNGKMQPIIETPQEAIEFLNKNNKLDYVIFNGKYKVSRK